MLNFLVDHAVFENQPVPGHFAAVNSTKPCTVGLEKSRKSNAVLFPLSVFLSQFRLGGV